MKGAGCRRCGWLGEADRARCPRCGSPDWPKSRLVIQLIGWDELPGYGRQCVQCNVYNPDTRNTRPFVGAYGVSLVWVCPQHFTPSIGWRDPDPFSPEGRGYKLPGERGYTRCNGESYGDPPCGGCDSCLRLQFPDPSDPYHLAG